MSKFKEITIQDLQNDPTKYGVPTFEQFAKDPKKYSPQLSEEEQLSIIDNGGQNLKRYTKKKIYEVMGRQFETLEKAHDFCRDHGFPVKNWKVVTYNTGGQRGEEKVIIMPPEEFNRRNKW